MKNVWQMKTCDEELAQKISETLNISVIMARLLVQRGITSLDEARSFLNPDLKLLTDPGLMQGMQAGVVRIRQAIEQNEKIVIYGDYDVDGVCSVVLLKECLERLGLKADYYVPNRFNEGYGLNIEAIEELARQAYKLIITVDCGISSVEEAELARQLGVDLIITDHHTPPEIQPRAIAIINPKNDQLPALTNLAGVGVAYKLAAALLQAHGQQIGQDYLDLVALATVADIVPLLDENRILVKYGLEVLEKSQRRGLQALMQKTGLTGKKLEAWHIGFVLGPRLNSAGRLDSARKSIELLLSQDEIEADLIAAQLCVWNDERRNIEESIYQQARLDIESDSLYSQAAIIIAAGEGWHEGVIGIVASRLANHYNRPAIVISWDGEKGRGSARSSGDLDLYAALQHCQAYLEQFGGHKMAAGLSLHKDNLALFRQALQAYMTSLESVQMNYKSYPVDMEIDDSAINQQLLNEISCLHPCGEGNPVPCFALRASNIEASSLVGARSEHFKCKTGTNRIETIAFNRADLMGPALNICQQDLLFELSENSFRGRSNLQLKIKDMKHSFCPDELSDEKTNVSQMIRAIEKTVDELAAGRPVLFVYPGHRSLSKHQGLLQGIFKPEQIQELHGRLPMESRNDAERQLAAGERKLFLTTQAFLEYYCERDKLPAALHYTLVLWPGEYRLGVLETDHIEIGILTNQSRCLLSLAGGDDPWEGRTIVYANRPSTIQAFSKNRGGVEIESGLSDAWQRKVIRQRFKQSLTGTLFIDGSHPPKLAAMDSVDHIILADSPFGIYELGAVLDYMDELEIPLKVSFPREDLNKNRTYLERIYPEKDLLQQVGEVLLKYGSSMLRANEEQLAARLASDLKRDFRSLDLLPVLYILADLGLCQFQKSGSIIATKFLKTNIDHLNLSNSPYYREGQREKSLFGSWEQSLNNNLVW